MTWVREHRQCQTSGAQSPYPKSIPPKQHGTRKDGFPHTQHGGSNGGRGPPGMQTEGHTGCAHPPPDRPALGSWLHLPHTHQR